MLFCDCEILADGWFGALVLLVVFSHYSAHQVNYLLQGDAEGDDDGRGLVQYGAVLDVVILQ